MIPVPPLVLEMLCASYGIDPARLVYLGGGGEQSEGIVYTCPHQGQSRVLKIGALPASDPAGFLRLEERLKFVHFLAEHEVDIVYPLARADGSLFARLQEGENIFVAYLMEKVSGSHPRVEEWDAPFLRRWGKVIGRMHRVTQSYPVGACSVLDPLTGRPILGWEQEWEDFYNWCKDEEVKQRWPVMRRRLAALPIASDSFGFIHNDPHHYNILVSEDGGGRQEGGRQDGGRLPGGRLVLLDFDVANYHWFVTDISIAMQGLLFDRTGGMDHPLTDPAPVRDFLDHFMQGYETENHLDPFWLAQLDLLISYRRMLLFTVMHGWISTKPALHASWKKMILDDPPLLNG